jgi:cytochrome c biogenesis protein CcdA
MIGNLNVTSQSVRYEINIESRLIRSMHHRKVVRESMRHSRINKKSRWLIVINWIVLVAGYLMLFAGMGCLIYTFADLYVLLKQAKLFFETMIRLLPFFIGGVMLLVVGGLLIKKAKEVLDRPF